jgi:hypothetical protein
MRVLTGLALWVIGQRAARAERRIDRRRARRRRKPARADTQLSR